MPDNLSGPNPAETDTENAELEETSTPAYYEYGASADGGLEIENVNTGGALVESRLKIREAIRSVYGPKIIIPSSEPIEPAEAEPVFEINPEEEAKTASRLMKLQAETIVRQAKEMARKGQKDHALQLLSQAIRIDPDNSSAWTWLGGLLTDRNPERARFCLEKALSLDPENLRAKRGLDGLNGLLEPQVEDQPEIVEEGAPVNPEMAMVLADPDSLALTEFPPDPATIKIGLAEALETWREISPDVHPEDLPLGGARFNRKKKKRFQIKFQGLSLSLMVLLGMLLLSMVGVWFMVAKPSFEPQPTATPVIPTATPTGEDIYAARLRSLVESYSADINRARELYRQFDSGDLRWDDLKRGYRDLLDQIKSERNKLNDLAGPTSANLLQIYKNLQELSQVSIVAANYMASGAENISDEDLNEGTRQFNRAAALLSDISKMVNQLSPTTTPALTVSPTTPAVNSIVTAGATISSTVEGTATPGPTATPPVTPTVPAATPTPSS